MQAGENPTAALAALLPEPVPVEGTAEKVRPFTLALYAMLDRIHSPLLSGTAKGTDALSLLPSLFIACRGVDVAFGPHLLERACAWADTLPPSALPAIREACEKQVRAMMDVVAEDPDKKKESPETGG